jgi:hypothetical protein
MLDGTWPVLLRHELAVGWLQVWADLGRAPRTIDAYALGLAEYLTVCEREGVAVDDGQAALDKLLDRLVDVPTPAGCTPRQIGAPATATLLPILTITKRRHDK